MMKKKVLKAVANISMYTAKAASNSASFWGLYQSKEPKKVEKDKK